MFTRPFPTALDHKSPTMRNWGIDGPMHSPAMAVPALDRIGQSGGSRPSRVAPRIIRKRTPSSHNPVDL